MSFEIELSKMPPKVFEIVIEKLGAATLAMALVDVKDMDAKKMLQSIPKLLGWFIEATPNARELLSEIVERKQLEA